ncbi:WD40-repeat-containing domain protein [Thamnocephalis sphaerospora]|uniref:U three protein 7 n=1 Tax=Thamnocephalis sphaerospora TaxID=78915 RepID=A0A4P9XWM2_9FUNG|nr:WD40-repeat-containing domain protein [Thamnocephalis sphaerospora]|eukprot:RKP09800.1 WD40-repeat-containing domain protein [Thamnocephalis sphaerospora]
MANDKGKRGMKKAEGKMKPRQNKAREQPASVSATVEAVVDTMTPEMKERMAKYERTHGKAAGKRVKSSRLRNALGKADKFAREAAETAARAEMLLTEEAGYLEAEGMEKTFKFTQRAISDHLDITNQKKIFSLKLDTFGPYAMDYTRNGRHMLIGGRRGHVATFDWRAGKLGCELNLNETVRDVCWLHNETMFAAAQKKHVYIYDHTGMEIHCLKKHGNVNQLEFLPYHFLLVSVNDTGYLKYQDTSTGQLIAEIGTGLGNCNAMTQNPYNAVMHLGHANGAVTLWSPNVTTPLVKIQCHKGPVSAISVNSSGHYMATAGLDGQLKIWDIRKFAAVHEYYTPKPATSLDISQRDLLAVGYGTNVTIWKDALQTKQASPYMNHQMPRDVVHDVRFCPYDDVLGYGHSNGISSIVVPGSGEPNFDSYTANPYQTTKQRREAEVHALLEKVQPDLIMLEPNFIGRVEKKPQALLDHERLEALNEAHHEKKEVRNRKRGRNSATRRQIRRVKKNIVDERRLVIEDRLAREKEERAKRRQAAEHGEQEQEPGALDKFYAFKNKRARGR